MTMTTTVEAYLTRELNLRFIDARTIATEARLHLQIHHYPSKEQEQAMIRQEACRIFFHDRTKEERRAMQRMNADLQVSLESSSLLLEKKKEKRMKKMMKKQKHVSFSDHSYKSSSSSTFLESSFSDESSSPGGRDLLGLSERSWVQKYRNWARVGGIGARRSPR